MKATAQPDLLDRFDLVVDPDAEPLDLDRFLNALDRLVERRLAARQQPVSRPATRSRSRPSSDSTDTDTGDGGQQA